MEITPTLVIGIGGTGKKVIMEIKRQLFESYGLRKSTSTYDEHLGYPVIQFLCIDTDTQDNTNIFENNYNSAVITAPENMQLKTHEFLGATIDSTIYNSYKQNLSGNPYISSWMPQEVMDKNNANIVSNGAGQHRLFARLCFFHNFKSIKSKILEKLETIHLMVLKKDVWTEMLEPEVSLPLNPKTQKYAVNIFIVTSLAGGTGCGMFLDLSMLTKNLLSTNSLNRIECRIDNIALMPSGYIGHGHGNKDRVLANAYAALKEVELLSLKSKTKYPLAFPGSVGKSFVEWTADPFDKYQITGGNDSPWDLFYLVDVTNNKNQISNASCIKMIADRIFLNFDNSKLPSTLRSLVSNDVNSKNITDFYENPIKDNAQNEILKKISSQKYGTFGLSSYKFDRENLKRRAAHVLGERLCSFLLTKTQKNSLGSDDISKMASLMIGDRPSEEDLSKSDPLKETGFAPSSLFYLLLSKTKDNITKYLEGNLTGSFKKYSLLNFQEQLQTLFTDLNSSSSVKQTSSPNDLEETHKNLLKIIAEHNKNLEVIPDHISISGINIPREIKVNCKYIITYIPQYVKSFLIRSISEFGVDPTLQILEKIAAKISVWRDYNRQVNKISEDHFSLTKFDYRIIDAKKIMFPWFRKTATEWEIMRIENDLVYFLEEKYYRTASDSIEQIYSALLEAISETDKQEKVSAIRATKRFKNLLDLNNKTVDGLGDFFKKNAKELEGVKTATKSQGVQDNRVVYALDSAPWEEERFKSEITKFLDDSASSFEDIDKQKFIDIEQKFLVDYKDQDQNLSPNFSLGDLQNSIFEFNSLVAGSGQNPIYKIEKIYNSIIKACISCLPGFANNVLVSDIILKDNYRKNVSNLALYSTPYLVKANEVDDMIGLRNTTWESSTQLLAYKKATENLEVNLREVPGTSWPNLQPITMADDSIVVYQDMLGLPLGSISVIKDLSDAYNKLASINVELHLDKQFKNYSPDLRPIVPIHYPKYLEIFSNVINGIILGSLELNISSSSYMLNDSSRGSNFKFTLVLDRLIDKLFVETSLNDLLEKKNSICFGRMNDSGFLGYYVALQKLWVDLHIASNLQSNHHPVMELIVYILIPHIVNFKQNILINNADYIQILKLVNNIKASSVLDRDLLLTFNKCCEKFLNSPTGDALNLTDYFPINTLKF